MNGRSSSRQRVDEAAGGNAHLQRTRQPRYRAADVPSPIPGIESRARGDLGVIAYMYCVTDIILAAGDGSSRGSMGAQSWSGSVASMMASPAPPTKDTLADQAGALLEGDTPGSGDGIDSQGSIAHTGC